MRIIDEGEQQVEMLLHQRPDLAVRQALGRGIDRQYQARIAPLVLVIGFGQHDVFARHELLAVVVADRSGQLSAARRTDEAKARPALDTESRILGIGCAAARTSDHGSECNPGRSGEGPSATDGNAQQDEQRIDGDPADREDEPELARDG